MGWRNLHFPESVTIFYLPLFVGAKKRTRACTRADKSDFRRGIVEVGRLFFFGMMEKFTLKM